ncbi:MAG TPA: hypothetical protein VF266_17060 [Thermoanaerobaculia bacterium]
MKVVIDASDDVSLGGMLRHAVVRGYDVDPSGRLTRLLVQLDSPIHYSGRYAAAPRDTIAENEIEWLVAEPRPGLSQASRLLLFGWWHARIVDAPSFVASAGRQPIGIARLRRRWRD